MVDKYRFSTRIRGSSFKDQFPQLPTLSLVLGFGTIIQTVAAFKSLAAIATTLKAVTTALEATAVAEVAVAEGAAVAGAATAAATLPVLPIVLAIAAAVGIAAIAWGSYESATEQAAKVTADQIKATADSRDQYQELSSQLSSTVDAHQKLAEVLGKLPASSQAYAGALQTEGEKLSYVSEELKRQKELQELLLVTQRGTLAAGLAEQQDKLDKVRAERSALEEEARKAAAAVKSGEGFAIPFSGANTAAESQATLGIALEGVIKKEQEANKVRNETAQKLGVAQKALGATSSALLEYQRNAGASTSSIDSLNRGLTEFESQQSAAKNATNDTNAALQAQADAANDAAKAVATAFASVDLAGIQKGIKGEVDKITKEVILKGGGLKEAAKLLKERRQQPIAGASEGRIITLNDLSEREKQAKAVEDFLNKQLTPQKSRGGGGRTRTRDDARAYRDAELSFQRSLSEQAIAIAKAEADARRGVLDGQLSDDLVSIKDFYAKRRQIERDQLKLELANQQDIQAAEYKKLTEVQASLPKLLKSAKPADRAGVEGKALADQLNIKSQIAATESRITEINIKAAADRGKSARDEVLALKALRDSVFEVRKEFLLLSGDSATAGIEETTKKANEQIKKLLVNGQIIAALQAAQNRDIKNSRSVAGGIGEKVSDVQRDADLVRLKIQNDLKLGIIGEGQARKETLKLEEDLRDATADLLQQQLKLYKGDGKAVADLQRQIELLRILGQDEDALRAKRAKSGFLNDKAFLDTAKKEAGDARVRSQESVAKQIVALEDQIANSAEGSADRTRLAWLQANRDIQASNEKASDEFIQNQVKLQQSLDVDPARLNDGVVKLLAEQKTLQQTFQDFRANQVQTVFDGINSGVDKMTEKFGEAGKAINQLLKDLLKLAATKFFEKVFGINQQPAGNKATRGQSGGGINPLQLLTSGGGSGGGGGSFLTPSFNPAGGGGGASGGSGGGFNIGGFNLGGAKSLLGKIPGLGKLFGGAGAASGPGSAAAGFSSAALDANGIPVGLGSGGAAGAGGGAAVGSLASLGAGGLLAGGGFLGSLAGGKSPIGKLIGGAGGALLGGVLGASGLLGGGLAAALPAFFTNPITAIIGAGLIGTALLFKFFGNKDFKKFQKETDTAYQLKVKDDKPGQELFGQIKSLGEASFGKGQFKTHIAETIRLDQAKQILAAYGEQTSQTQSELVKRTIATREIGSETNSANRFARAFGGPVYAGQSYVVGDGGKPEIFSPSVGGQIFPSTQSYDQAYQQQLLKGLQSGKYLGGIFAGIRQQLINQAQAQLNSATPANVAFNADRNASKQQSQSNQGDQGNSGQEKMLKLIEFNTAAINRIDQTLQSIDAVPPDSIFQKVNPKLVSEKNNEGLRGNANAKQDLQRNLGI